MHMCTEHACIGKISVNIPKAIATSSSCMVVYDVVVGVSNPESSGCLVCIEKTHGWDDLDTEVAIKLLTCKGLHR